MGFLNWCCRHLMRTQQARGKFTRPFPTPAWFRVRNKLSAHFPHTASLDSQTSPAFRRPRCGLAGMKAACKAAVGSPLCCFYNEVYDFLMDLGVLDIPASSGYACFVAKEVSRLTPNASWANRLLQTRAGLQETKICGPVGGLNLPPANRCAVCQHGIFLLKADSYAH